MLASSNSVYIDIGRYRIEYRLLRVVVRKSSDVIGLSILAEITKFKGVYVAEMAVSLFLLSTDSSPDF